MKGSCWATVKKMPQLVGNPNFRVYRDAVLIKLEMQILFKI
jgi:hypothetical protein